uniref:Uncharacterized 11.4 kDa protein in trnR-chlB intergenic region n=1 Tax=Chlamydomonas reinhardtii TaxID=3055 RepID=YCX5_CHLRE|nr:RecName: Full=Uncharacterized 11.4 kDa protein in trnR-chlB intergenic region; AltName: Full=ORF101 [Chlamydomonas reinhardtii]
MYLGISGRSPYGSSVAVACQLPNINISGQIYLLLPPSEYINIGFNTRQWQYHCHWRPKFTCPKGKEAVAVPLPLKFICPKGTSCQLPIFIYSEVYLYASEY